MYTFIIYLFTFLFSTFTTFNCDADKSMLQDQIVDSIASNDISYSIKKIDENSFNLMIQFDVSTVSKADLCFDAEALESILKISVEENNVIKMDAPIVEAFSGCKGADDTVQAPIKTVRMNVLIHLTELGVLANTFELKGQIACTMPELFTTNDTDFKIAYANKEMIGISAYRPIVFSN